MSTGTLIGDRIDSYGGAYPGFVPTTNTEAGSTPLLAGQDYIDIVFVQQKVDSLGSPTTNWLFSRLNVECSDNPPTLKIWPGPVVNKTAAGCRVYLNAAPDTGHFTLDWKVS